MSALALIAATAAVGALAGVLARRWLAWPARVESSSMEPTLRPGQRVLVRRLRGTERVARGDLVVVRSAELGRVVVKRAVGLPREVVQLDTLGRIRVDGQRLVEPPARRVPGRAARYDVPDGSLFVLGDNRRASSDSRTWRQPYVPADAVVGKVVGKVIAGRGGGG